MGSCVFVAMSTMKEVDTHEIDGCVQMHQGTFAIEAWGNPSHIQCVVEKIIEVNQKLEMIGQVVRQTLAPKLKHDKIQAQWDLDIPLESMLERV
jgi:hypothetical protein